MPRKTRKEWWIFFSAISLVTLAFIAGVSIGVGSHVEELFRKQVLSEAQAHFTNIVLTRRWNAQHGGVFVEKVEGVVSNPYLENPDIVTIDGVVYTKKNPALMTREISVLADEAGEFKYHITSLRPLNNDNAADAFETDALKRFERGEEYVFTEFIDEGRNIARYMAPLMVEDGCMLCHAKQGYSIGEVRGGISVTLDVTPLHGSLKNNRTILFVLVGASSSMLLILLILFSIRLRRRLDTAHETINILAQTDELTGAANRRYLYEAFDEAQARNIRYERPLSVIMLDIDYFKQVNDTHGHLAGDHVLQQLVRIMVGILRETDLVARFGGEEFIALLPEEGTSKAVRVAERMRKVVEQTRFIYNGKVMPITISCGVASREKGDLAGEEIRDQMFAEADAGLYAAKEAGRNSTVHYKGIKKD